MATTKLSLKDLRAIYANRTEGDLARYIGLQMIDAMTSSARDISHAIWKGQSETGQTLRAVLASALDELDFWCSLTRQALDNYDNLNLVDCLCSVQGLPMIDDPSEEEED